MGRNKARAGEWVFVPAQSATFSEGAEPLGSHKFITATCL